LGAPAVAWLAREGAHLGIGYRTDRERAEASRHATESAYSCRISLVAEDVGAAEVRAAYLATAQKIRAPLAGGAIFPGEPTRMPFENLNSETLLASLESNWVGPVLLAEERSATMGSSVFFSNATITLPARPSPLMAASRCGATAA
jgi:hypothetical protein